MPLRLEDAIRRGHGTPQTWTRVVEMDDQGKICATCAIGGAVLASGSLLARADSYHAFTKRRCVELWPWLQARVECPACGETDTIFEVICYHIGAGCRLELWSREQIAIWVHAVEPKGGRDVSGMPSMPGRY